MGETFNSHLTDDVGAYDSQNHTMIGGGLVTRMYNDLGGIAVSNWSVLDGAFSWEVTVPVNASAEIVIPAEVAEDLTESGRDVFEKDGDGLTYIGRNEDGDCVYAAGSGTYRFETAAGSSGRLLTTRSLGGGLCRRSGLAGLVAGGGAEGFATAKTLGVRFEAKGQRQAQDHGDTEETLHQGLLSEESAWAASCPP